MAGRDPVFGGSSSGSIGSMMSAAHAYPSEPVTAWFARRFVRRFASKAGCTPDEIADVTLASGEIVANAIEHGHAAHGYVRVRCDFDGSAVKVSVADSGPGFGASGKRDARKGLRPRGHGLVIVRAIADDVEIHSGNAGAVVSFTKRCKNRVLTPAPRAS